MIKTEIAKSEATARRSAKGQKVFFQPKLTINPPDDVHEQETDAVETTAPTSVNDVVNSNGRSLDAGTRNFMESRFGEDFGDVQIHNDSSASQSSKDINALAYTHGNHIVFGSGQYQPGIDSGKKLLAHELAHVVQQRSAPGTVSPKIMRKDDLAGRTESVTGADGKKYVISRNYSVLTPEGSAYAKPTTKFDADTTNIWFEVAWCKDTRGNIKIGTNLPEQAVDLFQRLANVLTNGGGGQEILNEVRQTDLTPFLNIQVAKSKKWDIGVQTNITVNPSSGDVSKGGGAISISTEKVKLSVSAQGGKDGYTIGANVTIPLGGSGVQQFDCKKEKIPAQIRAVDNCELITPEHKEPKTTTKTVTIPKTVYLYFEYAKTLINNGRTKPELDTLNTLLLDNYVPKRILGFTSPEGSRTPATTGDWEGNDSLAKRRAETTLWILTKMCSDLQKARPELDCPTPTLDTQQLSELYTASKPGGEEEEGTDLIEKAEPQFRESAEEERFMNDPKFREALDKAKTPKQKERLIYPLLRRSKIILEKTTTTQETKDETIPEKRDAVDCQSVPGYDNIKLNWDVNDRLFRNLNIK
jgi:hypothetical protein